MTFLRTFQGGSRLRQSGTGRVSLCVNSTKVTLLALILLSPKDYVVNPNGISKSTK